MEIEGKITKVTRSEVMKDGSPVIHVTAQVEMPHRGTAKVSDFAIYGYEPTDVFKLGQKVVVTIAAEETV